MAKLLVVDDSSTLRQSLCSFLKENGHETLEAENGEEGLKILDSNAGVDLVLTDINMPVMDGIAMIKQLRERTKFLETPVFVFTTEASPELMKTSRDLKVKAWILKPFNPTILKKALDRLFVKQ